MTDYAYFVDHHEEDYLTRLTRKEALGHALGSEHLTDCICSQVYRAPQSLWDDYEHADKVDIGSRAAREDLYDAATTDLFDDVTMKQANKSRLDQLYASCRKQGPCSHDKFVPHVYSEPSTDKPGRTTVKTCVEFGSAANEFGHLGLTWMGLDGPEPPPG